MSLDGETGGGSGLPFFLSLRGSGKANRPDNGFDPGAPATIGAIVKILWKEHTWTCVKQMIFGGRYGYSIGNAEEWKLLGQ